MVAVVAVGFDIAPRPALTGQELVAALEAEGSNVKLVAFYDESAGTVRLAALSGDAVPDKDFELWAIKGSNAPQSMGVIPVNARSDVRLSGGAEAGLCRRYGARRDARAEGRLADRCAAGTDRRQGRRHLDLNFSNRCRDRSQRLPRLC